MHKSTIRQGKKRRAGKKTRLVELGITLDPWQKAVYDSVAPVMILRASRQAGKTTVLAAVAWKAMTIGKTVLILAPNFKQALLLIGHMPRGKKQSEITHESGGKILAIAADEVGSRGYTADVLIIDEAAHLDAEIFRIVRPAVAATGGRIICATTGTRSRTWIDLLSTRTDAQIITVPWNDCPRITHDHIEDARRMWGDAYVAREYLEEPKSDIMSSCQLSGHLNPNLWVPYQARRGPALA